MALNPKQKLFVAEYLKDLNATQAATRAGYSAKTARSQGQRLLTNADIKAEIEKQKQGRSERTKIDADWLLSRLADECEADAADLYDDAGNIKPIRQWPDIWRKGLVSGMDVDRDGILKIRLSDRAKRLEMIGKHVDVQAFKDKLEVEESMTLAERIKRARERRGG